MSVKNIERLRAQALSKLQDAMRVAGVVRGQRENAEAILPGASFKRSTLQGDDELLVPASSQNPR
jgi:hypothetical protein